MGKGWPWAELTAAVGFGAGLAKRGSRKAARNAKKRRGGPRTELAALVGVWSGLREEVSRRLTPICADWESEVTAEILGSGSGLETRNEERQKEWGDAKAMERHRAALLGHREAVGQPAERKSSMAQPYQKTLSLGGCREASGWRRECLS